MAAESGKFPLRPGVDHVLDTSSQPRHRHEGIVIFVCEHDDGKDFMSIEKDPPPKSPPTCATCGKAAVHVGLNAYFRLLEKHGMLGGKP